MFYEIRRKRQGEDRSTQTNNNQTKSGKRPQEKSGKSGQDQRHSGSSQDSAGQVVRRQQKDSDAHLRRGSLKSRIFQFKKGRSKRGDNGNDTTDNAANIHSRSDLLTLHNQSALNIQNYDKEPVSARQQRAPLVVSLRDSTPPTPSRQPTPPTNEQQPIYAKPVKKQFRIYSEDKIEQYNGRDTTLLNKENIRIEPLRLSPHAKDYHEIRRPLGLSIPAPNSPTKPSPRFSQVTDFSGNSGMSSESIPSSPRNQEHTYDSFNGNY